MDWRWLASPDDLVDLVELFFTRTALDSQQERF
jgi:hypothetical protein